MSRQINPARDYYAILGVRPDATQNEIKQAFRRKAKELHPDVNPSPDAAQQFKRLNEAYQILDDTRDRMTYDLLRGRKGRTPYTGYSPPHRSGKPERGRPASAERAGQSVPPTSYRRPPRPRYATTRRKKQRRNSIFFWVSAVVAMNMLMCSLAGVLAPPEQSDADNLAADLSYHGYGDEHRATALPRRTEVWTIYPDRELGFTALFTIDLEAEQRSGYRVDAPYLYQEDEGQITEEYLDLASVSPIEGNQDFLSLADLYEREDGQVHIPKAYLINPETGNEFFGIALLIPDSPHYNADQNQIIIPLLPSSTLEVQIIALALPPEFILNPTVPNPSYQEKEIDGWTIIYFDLSDPDFSDTFLQIFFTRSPEAQGDSISVLDVWEIDAAR